MKTMVVGGAGFIGSHLCDALLEKEHEVVCIDNFSLGTKKNIEHMIKNDRYHLYEVDATDKQKLEEIFLKEEPEYVFHLAANSDIQASSIEPSVEYQNTYTTTYNILDCMRKYKVKNLFFASTSAVYGDKKDIELREDTPNLSPISYYGAAKLGSEALISAFSYMNDMQALIFRFPNVIGPRLTHGVIYDFIRKLEDNPTLLQILGDGKQTKQYIYVSDLVSAILKFINIQQNGISLYNLGVDGATSVTSIADILCEEMELSNVKYIYTGGSAGWKGDVPKYSYCLDKIHAKGWKAKYNSDEAVRKTVQMILGRKELN